MPPARLVSDPARRPVAPLASPRTLACNPVGTVFGVASELIECGRARYQRGELEAARQAFQTAAQETNDRELQREARYWLGETLLRLGRPTEVERYLVLVAQDDPRGDFGLFATHTLGWVALDMNEPGRALARFESLLKGRMPVVLIPPARHGRALALYGLKRYAEARDEWVALLASNPPRPLAGEATFWLGDTLGRLGDEKGAVSRLKAFTAGGPQPLTENALLSLGWWSRAAGQPADAVQAYRALLSAYPQSASAPWARAGLVLALLDQNDFAAAREEAKRLEASSKTSPLVLPTLLSLRRWAADKGKVEEGQALDTDLLARTLEPETRAWVLLLSGELARQAGNAGEARDRLELVRSTGLAAPAIVQQAELRLAQIDFDAREYAQAQTAAQALLNQPLADDVRAAALLLVAESAYWARNWDQAATSYSRFVSDFPKRPEAPAAGFALGWAEFRRGRLDAARERWAAFAREAPADPRAGEALLLAAELAAKAGDRAQARAMLDRVVGQYPGTEQAEVARLNRAILSLNAGRATDALAELNRVGPGSSTSSSPYLGRARVAKGLALVASKQPAAAESELKAALGQGDDAISQLGLGVIAFGRGQWDAAARGFGEARDAGAGGVAAAAEYGLAAVAFNQRKTDDFKKLAGELLAGPDDPATTPLLLRGHGSGGRGGQALGGCAHARPAPRAPVPPLRRHAGGPRRGRRRGGRGRAMAARPRDVSGARGALSVERRPRGRARRARGGAAAHRRARRCPPRARELHRQRAARAIRVAPAPCRCSARRRKRRVIAPPPPRPTRASPPRTRRARRRRRPCWARADSSRARRASGTRRGRCSSAPSRTATRPSPPRPPITSAKACARPDGTTRRQRRT